jgi:hypothetical protein
MQIDLEKTREGMKADRLYVNAERWPKKKIATIFLPTNISVSFSKFFCSTVPL